MITEQDLKEAIAELQGRRNPTSTDCQKLAAYYTILDHLADVTDDEIRGASAMSLYSHAEPSNVPEVISYNFNNQALNDSLNGRTSDYAYWLLDELMTACSVLDMRLYSFIERKLKE